MARKPPAVPTGQKSIPAMMKGAERLRAFQETLPDGGPLTRETAQVLAERLELSTRRIQSLHAIYLIDPTASALAPEARGRRRGTHLLRDDVVNVTIKLAGGLLNVQCPPSRNAAAEQVRSILLEKIDDYSFEVDDLPSDRQILRIIENLPPTYWKPSRSIQHKTSLEPHYSQFTAEKPLGAVQMDHSPIKPKLLMPKMARSLGGQY